MGGAKLVKRNPVFRCQMAFFCWKKAQTKGSQPKPCINKYLFPTQSLSAKTKPHNLFLLWCHWRSSMIAEFCYQVNFKKSLWIHERSDRTGEYAKSLNRLYRPQKNFLSSTIMRLGFSSWKCFILSDLCQTWGLKEKNNTQLENEDMGFLAMWIMFEHRDYGM